MARTISLAAIEIPRFQRIVSIQKRPPCLSAATWLSRKCRTTA
ncbi:hypothetical protein [Hyalangium minutum]|uniref:Uncharacterized protein n=1 Tax=Hyalangium minutum TaxID=394096 RepID=A0A085WIW6_9BACT|nr:hypothetical protein [Hyalangium minutum]KFE67629.1 hypothetical protein DB31_8112 [Hyalangium minutum]